MDSSRDVPAQREYFLHESLIQWVTAEGESSWMPSFGYNFFVSIVKTEFAIRVDANWMRDEKARHQVFQNPGSRGITNN